MTRTVYVVVVGVVLLTMLVAMIFYIVNTPTTITTTSIVGKESKLKIIVLVDNNVYDSRLKTTWGISILVEVQGSCILFDTGPSPEVLLYNARILGVNLSCITSIVLSHEHGDHVGGIEALKRYAGNIVVYVPRGFSERMAREIELKGFRIMVVNSTMCLSDGVYILKPLYGPPWEQALVLKTSKGLVIVTGCSHPGIARIVREAVREFNEKPYIVIGGFHLIGKSARELERIVDELIGLGVKKIYPLHCSGNMFRSLLEKEYPAYYGRGGVGLILTIPG